MTLSRGISIGGRSLDSIAKAVLGMPINKGLRNSNWEATSLSENAVKCASNDALISLELHLELSRHPDLTTPPMRHQIMGGLEVGIAPYLGSSTIFNKGCSAGCGIVVEDTQHWTVPSHLHVKYKRDLTLEKAHHLIEIREMHTPALKIKGTCKSGTNNSYATLEDLSLLPAKIILPIEILRINVLNRPKLLLCPPKNAPQLDITLETTNTRKNDLLSFFEECVEDNEDEDDEMMN